MWTLAKTRVLLAHGFVLPLTRVCGFFRKTSEYPAHRRSPNPPFLRNKRFLCSTAGAIILAMNGLAFAGLILAQTGEQGIRVKIHTRERTDAEKSVPLGGVTVKIGSYTVTTDESGEARTVVARGNHVVKALLKGFIVADMHVYPDALGGQHGGGPAKSDEGDLELPFLFRSSYEEETADSTLTVWMKAGVPPQKEEAKEIALAAASEDCREFDWAGSQITFSPPGHVLPDGTRVIGLSQTGSSRSFQLSKYGLAQSKTELKPGTYEVRFEVPLFTDARISKVEVYRAFPRLEIVGTYPADEAGFAEVPLDASLWKDTSTPYVKVNVVKLCDLSYAIVEYFVGNVEVSEEGSAPETARAGMKLFKSASIKTGPGSSVRLKTEGGIYIITIGESVQLNIGALVTGQGRKFIEASIKKGQIEIKRVLFPERPRPMPPGEGLPEPLPSDPGITVKTTTAIVTEKHTAYTVSYDEKTNSTRVGVEEGEVEVTPTQPSLKPVTLRAGQMVEVTALTVSAVTPFSQYGGFPVRILIYAGLGIAGLLVIIGLFYFSRRQPGPTAQSHFPLGGISAPGWNAPANARVINGSPQRCQDPRCGKVMPAGKKFCTTCGARLRA